MAGAGSPSAPALRAPRWPGGRRVLGPVVLRVAAPQLAPDLGVGSVPEAPQVARGLHRAAVGREQLEGHGHLIRSESRRVGLTEQLL